MWSLRPSSVILAPINKMHTTCCFVYKHCYLQTTRATYSVRNMQITQRSLMWHKYRTIQTSRFQYNTLTRFTNARQTVHRTRGEGGMKTIPDCAAYLH